jgi:hypothetical protein
MQPRRERNLGPKNSEDKSRINKGIVVVAKFGILSIFPSV